MNLATQHTVTPRNNHSMTHAEPSQHDAWRRRGTVTDVAVHCSTTWCDAAEPLQHDVVLRRGTARNCCSTTWCSAAKPLQHDVVRRRGTVAARRGATPRN